MRLVEMGPGRGTLMADLLRGSAPFKAFISGLDVHLVEVSISCCSPCADVVIVNLTVDGWLCLAMATETPYTEHMHRPATEQACTV